MAEPKWLIGPNLNLGLNCYSLFFSQLSLNTCTFITFKFGIYKSLVLQRLSLSHRAHKLKNNGVDLNTHWRALLWMVCVQSWRRPTGGQPAGPENLIIYNGSGRKTGQFSSIFSGVHGGDQGPKAIGSTFTEVKAHRPCFLGSSIYYVINEKWKKMKNNKVNNILKLLSPLVVVRADREMPHESWGRLVHTFSVISAQLHCLQFAKASHATSTYN